MATINQTIDAQKHNPEQLKALAYIKHLAAMTNANIVRWNVTSIFGSGNDTEVVLDKKEINKRFFEKYQEVADKNGTEVGAPSIDECGLGGKLQEIALAQFKTRERDLKYRITRQLENANSYHHRALEHLKAATEARKEMALLGKEDLDSELKEAFNRILTKGNWVNPVIENNFLYLNTRSDVVISYENKAAEIDIKLNVGKLAVKIDINSFTVSVIPYKNNIRYNDHFHPHIDNDGTICWGDAHRNVHKWTTEMKIDNVLEVLYSLLYNYSDENPYVSVQRMHEHATKYGRCAAALMHPDKKK